MIVDIMFTDVSGAFLDDCKVAEVLKYTSSKGNAESLWNLNEKTTEEKFIY